MDKGAASVLPGLVDVLGAGTCGAETGAAAHLSEAPWCVFVPHHAGLCSCSQRTGLLCALSLALHNVLLNVSCFWMDVGCWGPCEALSFEFFDCRHLQLV